MRRISRLSFETLLRKAIRGDMQAAGIIADRIEGKVGTRRDKEGIAKR